MWVGDVSLQFGFQESHLLKSIMMAVQRVEPVIDIR